MSTLASSPPSGTAPLALPLPGPADVVLADGSLGVIRRLTHADGPALHALHDEVSDDTLRMRFFNISRRAAHTYVDHVLTHPETLALVAETDGRLVGLATAEPVSSDTVEIALVVSDEHHGQGLGTLLLEHLFALVRDRGMRRLEADVLVENHPMLDVLANAGYELTQHPDRGVVSVNLRITSAPAVQDVADRREFQAESRSLAPLLAPQSVAVAGVRSDGTGVGAAVLRSIQANGYAGRLVVVHPRRKNVSGVRAYPSFTDVPDPVDLALIAVPAEATTSALQDAAAAGVRAVVVISSGFGELGPQGKALQRELLLLSRTRGIRLVGPNCLGVLANDPAIRLNATFNAQQSPPPGGLAIASQSGGVGIVLLDRAKELGLGVRSFVSLGNTADVSSNDLLAAWYDDPGVTAAALYLESFGNARKFARFARRFSERKPVLAVVGGRSKSGQRGGASHTAAAASSDVAVRALFAQSGVIGCVDADDLAEAALLLTEQPLPAGPRLAVLSNAGGMGILVADAAQDFGLVVPEFTAPLSDRLASLVHGTSGTTNPVDAGAAVAPKQMGAALDAVLSSGEVDAVVTVVVATGVTDGVEVVRRLAEVRARYPDIPVILVPLGGLDLGHPPGLTTYDSTNAAVRALGRAVGYVRWRTVPASPPPATNHAQALAARQWCRSVLEHAPQEGRWLAASEAQLLLDGYGLRLLGRVVCGADNAAEEAARIGFPVAVKLANAGGAHKGEQRLVRTGLTSTTAVLLAVAAFADYLGGATQPEVLVQPMESGQEVALGLVRDATMGPLVMVAAGGVATDVWDDRVFLLPPISGADAERAVRGLRMWPLLQGFRGAPAADVADLERLIVALGRLAVDIPEIAELDLNPVMVGEHSCSLVDVRLRLASTDDPGPETPRQLRRIESDRPSPEDQGPGSPRTQSSAVPVLPSRTLEGIDLTLHESESAMTTNPTAPVVIAADGTPSSEGALRYAVQEAVARRAGLRIVHVNPMAEPIGPLRPIPGFRPGIPSELTAHARRVLERTAEQARDLAPDQSVSTVLAQGGRVRGIIDGATDAQLVVVGRETRHGLERVLTGATTAGVASQARCPVVVVPGDWHPRSSEAGGTVLVGIRRAADAADLMATAYAWAAPRGASITVVHAWELPDPYIDRTEARTHAEEWRALGDQLLDDALACWRHEYPDMPVEPRVIHGHAASVLVAAAKEADLVIVRRAHEHRPFDHLGATVRALLLASPAPVEVVPALLGSEPIPDLVLEESGHIAK